MCSKQDVDEEASRTGKHKGGYPGSPASGHPAGIPPAPGRKRRRPHTLGKRTRRDLRGDLHRPRIKTVFKGSALGREFSASVLSRLYDAPLPMAIPHEDTALKEERARGETGFAEGLLDILSTESRPYPDRETAEGIYGKEKETETPRPAYRLKGFPKR